MVTVLIIKGYKEHVWEEEGFQLGVLKASLVR